MARQRNNIARMPFELREVVCKQLFAGSATQAEIVRAVRARAEELGLETWTNVKLHGSTFQAYQQSNEYKQHCERARGWNERLEKRRWAASLMRDGAGPQSLADLAELEILEQLHGLAAGGLLETGKDVATVARAITSLQRTQMARRQEEAEQRIEALKTEHAAEIAELQATIETLRQRLEEATGSREVDLSKIADEMDRVLG